MSNLIIRDALENRLKSLPGMLPTSWDNAGFSESQAPATAYQVVRLLPAQPDNPTLNQRTIRNQGLLRVVLYFPKGGGSRAAETYAESIRNHFPAGLDIVRGGLKIRIAETPYIAADLPASDRYIIPVSIRYNCFSKGA